MSPSYYVRIQGRVLGPFQTHQLLSMRDRGQFKQFHEVSFDQRTWYPAGNFPELFPSMGGPPAPARSQPERTLPMDAEPPPPRRRAARVDDYDDPPDQYDEPDYYNDRRPRRGGFPWVLVVGLLILLGGSATLVILLTSGNGGGSDANVVGGFEEAKLSQAIGNVVCGAEILRPDGELIEIPTTTGSSFVISSQGYLLTNKHVIEETQKLLRSPELKKKNQEGDTHIKPKVWVFFGNSSSERSDERKCQAEIVYVSDDFDLAILKVEEETPVVFRLSSSTDFPRNTRVFACGFPGAATGILSLDEEIKKKGTEKVLYPKVELYFNKRDFIFSSLDGPISRVFAEDRGRMWIQHAANIIHGYSGGPLMTEDGTVVGINTRVADAAVSKNFQIAPGIGYALTMPQMRKEIDRVVKDVKWK